MNPLTVQLQHSPLFDGFSAAELEQHILPCSTARELPKGGQLIRLQEPCHNFGILLAGKVNILHLYGSGDYGLSGVLEPGDPFGVDLVCTRSRIAPYYAEASHPSRVLTFPASVLESGLLPEQCRSRLLTNLLHHIANENMRKEYRLAILLQKGLRDRILTYLTMQANKHRTTTFSIPFTRDELASFLCVNRSCLSHELSRMEQEGLLRFHRNNFTLLSWDEQNGGY